MKINTSELDCFFISYDEPNRETHWAKLANDVPWAKRVDGVKGFDAAHKRCANESDTEYLITVDGDNQVNSEFFDLTLDVPRQYANHVLSWNSVNSINGLIYGNGGVKIWPKSFLLNMRSHEAADDPIHAVDFCWDDNYLQLNNVYSTTHPNGSALQAFRSGFREGCKMTLNNGQTVDQPEQLVGTMFHLNVERLQIWGSVGLDVDNGRWAILGTRVGTYYTNVLKSDIKVVNDYSEFTEYAEPWLKTTNGIYAATCARLADEIRDTTGIAFFDLDAKTSKFFKQLQSKNHHQVDSMVSEAHTLQNV